jgi:hypothetical protein
LKLVFSFVIVILLSVINNIYCQDTSSQLDAARNAARSGLNRENQHRQLLALYDATEYKFMYQMNHIVYPTTGDAVYRFEQQWEGISPGLVIVIDPEGIDIYGGANEYTFILQTSYMTPDDVRFNTVTYRQLVIQDSLELINYSHTRRIPNANGSDLLERNYKITSRILIKCIGMTNVTLANGRLVPRPLFRTILFNKDDPNNPEKRK